MASKELVLGTVEDLVSDFLYYDRKEDEELPRGAIQSMIRNKEISIDEIVAEFRSKLEEGLE